MVLHSDAATDVATVSNFRDVAVKSYHLDLDVNFDKQEIYGTVKIIFDVLKAVMNVKLDIHDALKIQEVYKKNPVTQERIGLLFRTKPFSKYGSELNIDLDKEHGDGSVEVFIRFTATGEPGVCWLTPEQTAGKTKPFVYTQGQAVLNRSFFPCQDTPAIKSTYSANVKVPEGFTPVMSASVREEYGTVPNMAGETDNYFFSLPQPIPVYLVALAVGDLQSARIGPRSCVWAEPSILEKARKEFDGEVELFLKTGERLFGSYVWDRYDILIMPPSFPFGGMENPCLTFVTPCILVGDKSLIDVVIHEISHSWFGNLVTNANWSEFWLNEGFTMFAQRRISSEIFGQAYTCLEASTGQALLKKHIENTGDEHPLNRLRVIIEPGVDPDDTYNECPYEKGYAFVSYLQSLVGDVKKFDRFLNAYVSKYKFKSLVAEDMLDYFLEYFPDLKEKKIDQRQGFEFIETWLKTPGWPPYTPDLSAGKEFTEPAEALANYWAQGGTKPEKCDISEWRTYQILHFLDKLVEKEKLTPDALKLMSEEYKNISQTENAEIRLRWSQLTIKHDYKPDFDNVRRFLRSQGKQKYTLPVYRALMKGSEEARKLANEMFEETKDQLHMNVQDYVQRILKQET